MTRPTQIGGGIQLHHQTNLDDASRNSVNMVQSLRSVPELTGRPEHQALFDEALALCRRIGDVHRAAQASLRAVYDADPARFYRCREGAEPWPDEIAEGFVPVCTCDRRCLFHHTQARGSTDADCNCAVVCPRHAIPREPGDREPLQPLPRGPGQSTPPSFGTFSAN